MPDAVLTDFLARGTARRCLHRGQVKKGFFISQFLCLKVCVGLLYLLLENEASVDARRDFPWSEWCQLRLPRDDTSVRIVQLFPFPLHC